MMSSFSRFFMVTTIGLMSVLLNWSSAAEEGKRFALLIGNEAYTALPPLKNPLSDIRGLASSLNALGFHVTAHENIGNGADMLQMIEIFAEKARAAGAESVLFHYAGHGFEIDGENYLIPTVIEPPREEEIGEQVNREMQTKPLGEDQRLDRLGELRLSHISAQAIKLNDVMAKIKQAAPTRIVMLDACRDRPSLRSVTPSENLLQLPRSGFAITEGDAGTMIVYSTQPEATADDGSGPVSPFMGAMLKHIDELGLDVNELMTRVRKDVYDYTQGRQVPWAHSALLEPFSFRPAPEGYFPENKLLVEDDPETKSKQLVELQEADNSHWQQVENSLNIGAYQGYLQNFPDGLHADEAMQLLAKLGAHYDSEITIADAAMVPGVNDDQRKARAVDQTRKRIVVLGDTDFVADRLPDAGGQAVGLPDALVDRIAANLAQSPRFEVLERQQLRRVISEQRFDRNLGETYLEKTFDAGFGDVRPNGGDVVIIPDSDPVNGSGIVAGSGLGAGAATADYLDLLTDFKDLGSSIGAEYLVFGRLESVDHEVLARRIPYTERVRIDETLSARLRLRVVDVEEARIIAAVSLETEIESDVFEGGPSNVRSAMFERLAREVTGALADGFHQATIIKTEPLVIDRGSIHGIQPGDTFAIKRPGHNELVTQDGISLGDHKTDVAAVRVLVTEPLWSEVEVIDGHQPALHDTARLDRDAMTTPFEGDSVAVGKRQPKALKPGGAPEEGLPRLAVLPVHFTGPAQQSALMANDTGDDWAEPFAQNIAAALHQSRRFQLLDRYDVQSFFNEADLAAFSRETPVPQDLVDLNIADHLVMAEISLLDFEDGQSGSLPRIGGAESDNGSAKAVDGLSELRSGHARAYLEGVIRIADGRTGAWLEARRISIVINLKSGVSEARALSELAKEFSTKAGLELINTVFPLKVASVSQDGTVYINRGRDGGLEAGEVLTAFRQGAEVIDPDTGIALGSEETMIGQVTITRVDDFASVGTLANLNQPLAKSDRLRRQNWNRGKTSGGSQVSGLGSIGGSGEEGETVDVKPGQKVLALRKVEIAKSGNFDLLPIDLVPRFGQELANRLRATKRYAVAERREIDEIFDEVNVNNLIEGTVGLPETLEAVDYAVLVRLDNLFVTTEREYIKTLDESLVKTKGVVEAQVRLVDVRSFEQVAAETIRFERQLEDNGANRDQRLLLGDMLAFAADEAVQRIMTVTFPMEIIGGGQGRWYVNRGADGGLSIGDAFMVLHQGDEMKDASGISFGRAEIEVGQARVVQVDAARSMIEMQEIGGDVSIGDILRPFESRALPQGSTATSISPEPKVNTPKW